MGSEGSFNTAKNFISCKSTPDIEFRLLVEEHNKNFVDSSCSSSVSNSYVLSDNFEGCRDICSDLSDLDYKDALVETRVDFEPRIEVITEEITDKIIRKGLNEAAVLMSCKKSTSSEKSVQTDANLKVEKGVQSYYEYEVYSENFVKKALQTALESTRMLSGLDVVSDITDEKLSDKNSVV